MARFAVYASTYSVRVAGVVASITTSILISRLLGPSGRGDVAAIIAAVALLVQFTGFGLSSSAVVELGESSDRAAEVSGLLILAALAVAPIAAAMTLALEHTGTIHVTTTLTLVVIAWPTVQLVNLNLQNAFLGLRRYGWFNALDLGTRLFALAAVAVLFAAHRATVEAVVAVSFSSDVFALLIAVSVYAFDHGMRIRVPRDLTRRMLMVGMRAYATQLPAYIVIRTDILFLRAWRTPAETGVYSVAAQVVTLMWLLPTAVGQVLFSSIAASGEVRAHSTARVARAILWLLIAAAVGAVVLGRPALLLLFGADFAGAYWYLLLLLPGAIALGFETVIVQYFNVQGFPVGVIWYWVIAAGLNLSMNALGIARYGATLAAVSSSVAYSVIAILVVRRFVRETDVRLSELWLGRGKGPIKAASLTPR